MNGSAGMSSMKHGQHTVSRTLIPTVLLYGSQEMNTVIVQLKQLQPTSRIPILSVFVNGSGEMTINFGQDCQFTLGN